MTDPETMAAQVDALNDRITSPRPPALNSADVITAHRIHVAGAYRRYIDKVGKIIEATGPRDGDLAVMNAQSSLTLGLACTLLAGIQMIPADRLTPLDGEITDTALHTRSAIDTLTQLVAATERTVAGAQGRLAMMHAAAAAGRIAGPPASSPTAEVEAVIRELITVTQSLQTSHRHLGEAVRRLGRLTYTPPAPTGP